MTPSCWPVTGSCTGAAQQTQLCTIGAKCSALNTIDGAFERLARSSALVPTEVSSQRPPATKLTVSALRRITRPPYVQRMRVSASVIAMTRSPSSAVRRSSASTRSTAVCSGESCQNARVSDSSASGASVTSREMAASERCQESRISGRTREVASSPCSTNAVQARTASRDVDQESADELGSGECHDLLALTTFSAIVLPSEGDAVAVAGDQPAAGDGTRWV